MGIGIEKYSSISGISANLMQGIVEKNGTAVSSVSSDSVRDTYEHVEQVSSSVKTQDQSKVKLSDKAQKVLEELKAKYGNTDFFVADYSSDEEAGQILSNSTKEFGVVIKPEELEKMASDEEYKNKISGVLADSEGKLSDFKNSLTDDQKSQIKSLGLTINDDGTVDYFAEIEKQTKAAAERIKEAKAAREDQNNAKTGEDSGYETRRGYVHSGTLNDLSELIEQFMTSDDDGQNSVSHIDYQL